jgi:Protein of unknown function with HXXEE motif
MLHVMDYTSRIAFQILILAQAAHSIEEYAFRLYAVFRPAQLVSALFSNDLRTGFAIANTVIVTVGIGSYLAAVRSTPRTARLWVWPWVVLEGANGVGHIVRAAEQGAYFPGVATAPILLVLSIWLVLQLRRAQGVSSGFRSVNSKL